MEWIRANHDVLLVLVNAFYALIWLAYLQLFLMSFLRQRQSVILIHRGASDDDRGRCMITNMGSEPIYVLAILAKIKVGGESFRAAVTDREELNLDSMESPLQRTTQGPLKSGEFLDAGSFRNLAQRALWRNGRDEDPSEVDEIEVTVAAAAAHASHIAAATRTFCRIEEDRGFRVVPQTMTTRQVRRRWQRKRIVRELEDATPG